MKSPSIKAASVSILLMACSPIVNDSNISHAKGEILDTSKHNSESDISFDISTDKIERGYALSIIVAERGKIKNYISSLCNNSKQANSCDLEKFFYTPSKISPVLKNIMLSDDNYLTKSTIDNNNSTFSGKIYQNPSDIIAVYYKINEDIRRAPGFVHIPISQPQKSNIKLRIFIDKKLREITTSTLYEKVQE